MLAAVDFNAQARGGGEQMSDRDSEAVAKRAKLGREVRTDGTRWVSRGCSSKRGRTWGEHT